MKPLSKVCEESAGTSGSSLGACLGCNKKLPEPFLDLGFTPLANSFIKPEEASRKEPVFPLAVSFCPECYLVQLAHLVPPEEMFSEYLYFSSYSDSFLAHAQEMAEGLIRRFHLHEKSRVLEVASNDGYLLQYFKKHGIPVLGVEPAKNIAEIAGKHGIPTLNRFFGLDSVEEILRNFGETDILIGNNVLAHVPAINPFFSSVIACLKPQGVAVFEFPYLKDFLDKTEFDTIYHEHVFYFSLNAVNNLAERAGLELFDLSHELVHGGSLRVFLSHPKAYPRSASVDDLLAREDHEGLTRVSCYLSFSERVKVLREKLRALLFSLKEKGKRLAAYGAPAKGNTLLNTCGIGRDLLEFTVDRSVHKQGLFTPGSRIPIRAPEDLLKEMPDYALILPWNIADEIVEQQLAYRRRGGRFLVPIPHPREV